MMNAQATTSITHDKTMAVEFLAALDPTASEFTFQFFSDAPDKRFARIVHGKLDEVWPEVEHLNTPERGVGVFVTINKTDGNGRSQKNIVGVRAFPIDADNDEQVAHCEGTFDACGVTPNIAVKTGKGKHYYFLVDDVALDEYTNYQHEIIEKLGTDRAVKDLPRVMRLPGTYHLKNPDDPRLVKLERANHHPRWTKGALAISLGFGFAASRVNSVKASLHKGSDDVVLGDFSDPAYHGWVQEHFGHLTDRLSDGIEADVEEIQSAARAIPPSALAEEYDWVRVARALAREAAIYPASAEKLRVILDDLSRRAPRYDEEENHRRWVRYKNEAFSKDTPITIATFFDIANKHGWSGHVQFAAPPYGPTHSLPRAMPISSLPQTPKKREWLCGTYLMRGAVSLLSAPGARGKTAWLVTLAMSCASGKPLIGAHLFGGPKTVLYLSAEESTQEINLRLRAAMHHHGISEADLSSLYIIGAERWGIHLVGVQRGTPYADENGWAALGAELDRLRPDILICDPLINFLGGADANNNSVAGLLMGRFAREAATRNMAVIIAAGSQHNRRAI
jgi:hypothetical protein